MGFVTGNLWGSCCLRVPPLLGTQGSNRLGTRQLGGRLPRAVTPLEKGVLPAGLRRDWPRRSGRLSAGGRPATGLFGAGGCPSGRAEQLVAEVTSWRAVVEGPGHMERGLLHPVSPLSCLSLEVKLKSWSSGRLRALRCAGSLLTRGNSSRSQGEGVASEQNYVYHARKTN